MLTNRLKLIIAVAAIATTFVVFFAVEALMRWNPRVLSDCIDCGP